MLEIEKSYTEISSLGVCIQFLLFVFLPLDAANSNESLKRNCNISLNIVNPS